MFLVKGIGISLKGKKGTSGKISKEDRVEDTEHIS